MNLTQKMLNDVGIYNGYDITQILKQNVFIEYFPANNGGLTSRYAFWRTVRYEGEKGFTREFTVRCREDKEPELKKAIEFIKNKTGIEITDKVLGYYHPQGTIEKLKQYIDNWNKEKRSN